MDESKNAAHTYLPILYEIRNRLLVIVLVFIGTAFAGSFFYEYFVTLFISLLDLKGATIIFSSPFEYMNLSLNCGIVLGIISTLPIIVHQIISFFTPAMTEKELHLIKRIIPLTLVLFVLGFVTGFIMMKYVGLLSYQTSLKLNINNYLNISSLLSTVLMTSALMGLAFEFPVVLILLARFHVISYKSVATKRPIAYLIAVLFAAAMPPTDILSLILLSIPLVILYEIVLLFIRNE